MFRVLLDRVPVSARLCFGFLGTVDVSFWNLFTPSGYGAPTFRRSYVHGVVRRFHARRPTVGRNGWCHLLKRSSDWPWVNATVLKTPPAAAMTSSTSTPASCRANPIVSTPIPLVPQDRVSPSKMSCTGMEFNERVKSSGIFSNRSLDAYRRIKRHQYPAFRRSLGASARTRRLVARVFHRFLGPMARRPLPARPQRLRV